MMDTASQLTILKTRRSIRSYLDKPVAKEIIEEILDCARMAPTARNIQPWAFVVLTGKEIKNRIADMTQNGKFLAQSSVGIALFCEDTKYYIEDGSAATQNILLAAWAYGLGSCWIAGDKKDYADEVRNFLGVPEKYKLVSLISIGYPAETSKVKKRSLKEMVHWEKFRGD